MLLCGGGAAYWLFLRPETIQSTNTVAVVKRRAPESVPNKESNLNGSPNHKEGNSGGCVTWIPWTIFGTTLAALATGWYYLAKDDIVDDSPATIETVIIIID